MAPPLRRERGREVDFVLGSGGSLIGIEVKSGRTRSVHEAQPGLAAFAASFRSARTLLVGGDGVPLEDFLSRPAELWLQGSGT